MQPFDAPLGLGDGGVTNPGYVPDHEAEQLEYSAASPDEKVNTGL